VLGPDDETADTVAVSSSTTPTTTVPPDMKPIVAPHVVLDTADGIRAFVDEYRTRFGDTIADKVTFYPAGKYVILTRATAVDRAQDITYRGGFDTKGDIGLRDSATQSFDLGTLDVAALGGLLAGAGQQVGLPDATISHVQLTDDGGPGYRAYLNDALGRSGWIEANFAGGDVVVHPYTP
jgi:hypothetical protein